MSEPTQLEQVASEAPTAVFRLTKRRKLMALAIGLLALSSLYVQYRIKNRISAREHVHPVAYQEVPVTVDTHQPLTKVVMSKIIIEKGKSLREVLAPYNVSNVALAQMIKAAQSQGINMEALKPNQLIEVHYIKGETDAGTQVKEISFVSGAERKLKLTQVQPGSGYQASIVHVPMHKELILMRGKIKNSIFASAAYHGVPIKNLIESTRACSYEVDFQRGIKNGDSFEILVEQFTSEDDQSVHFGKTVYFALNLAGRKYQIYRFKPPSDVEDFFTAEYKSARRGLLKTPVPMARITSKFSLRMHPVLGYSQAHQGVDFAAPQGTPIQAAGPGVVVAMEFKPSTGNYVKIKHNNEISTLYAHASRFAKNLAIGSRVKQGQTIAFIGMTGRATGPHLHYGLIYRGQYVDPLKFKAQPLKTLRGSALAAFKAHKANIDAIVQRQAMSQAQAAAKI